MARKGDRASDPLYVIEVDSGGAPATETVNLTKVGGTVQTPADWTTHFAFLDGIGSDGAAPPAITGTGVRGWLRAIYERLLTGFARTWNLAFADDSVDVSGSTVTVANPTADPETGLAKDATLAARLSEADFDAKVGSLTEAAPATDTASSGLNGRLQRIAQRITSLIGSILTVKTDQTTHGTTDLVAADITKVGGAAVTAGAGAVAAGTPRLTLASDDPAVVALGKLFATDYLCVKYETTSATADVDLLGADKNIVWVKVLHWDGANATFSGTGSSAEVAGSYLRIGATGKPRVPLWTLTKPDSDVLWEGYITGRIYFDAPTSAGKNLVLLIGVVA